MFNRSVSTIGGAGIGVVGDSIACSIGTGAMGTIVAIIVCGLVQWAQL